MNRSNNYLIPCFILITLWKGIQGQYADLQCYSCTVPGDRICITDPEAVTGQKIVDCPEGWCTLERHEDLDTPGHVKTFRRGCHKHKEPPLYLDDIVQSSHEVSYFRSCRTRLCNKGDGIDSLNRPGGGNSNINDIIVPAERSGAVGVGFDLSSKILCSLLLSLMAIRNNFQNFK